MEGSSVLPTVLEDARSTWDAVDARPKERRWTKTQLAERKLRGERQTPTSRGGQNPNQATQPKGKGKEKGAGKGKGKGKHAPKGTSKGRGPGGKSKKKGSSPKGGGKGA